MSNLNNIIVNVYTQKQIILAEPTNVEKELFDDSVLITETDLNGVIVYANRRYHALTGYSEEQLLGFPHSIVRHPDMPKGVFKAMWKIISEGKIWRGYIKHLCKDGSYFWTLSYIQPKTHDNNIVGYTSSGKIAFKKARHEVEEKYKELMDEEYIDDPYFMLSENYQAQCMDEENKFSE